MRTEITRTILFVLLLAVVIPSGVLPAAVTPGPARLLKDINPRGDSDSLLAPVLLGGRLYFIADDGIHGFELWSTDGTERGTAMVKDINPLPWSSVRNLTAAIGMLFMVVDDGIHGGEIWVSDGTASRTVLLKDINPGSSPYTPAEITSSHGVVFFTADDGVHGRELWKTDGTPAGTTLVADINPGPEGSSPGGLVDVEGTLFFAAYDIINGVELWVSDGTETGTRMVVNHTAGTAGTPFGWRIAALGTLFQSIDYGPGGWELWKSDGSAGETIRVQRFAQGAVLMAAVECDGRLFFSISNLGSHRYELWNTDGSEQGTVLVEDDLALENELACLGETLFFLAYDAWPGHGGELWKSDGTENGAVLVKDILPGSESGLPGHLSTVGETLLFTAQDGSHGVEPWRSDGTEEGTGQVQDIAPGPGSSAWPAFNGRAWFTPLGSRLLFDANDGLAGFEPWIGRTAILLGRPAQALRDLRDEVRGLRLARGVEKRLIAGLDTAASELSAGDAGGAAQELTRFMKEVSVHTPRGIDADAAGDLLEFAQDLVDLLERT